MSDRKSAAITHFVVGGLTVASALKGLISYGKPWALSSLRHEFKDYQTIAIEEVPRARGTVYRLVASGPKGSKLITFTFSAESARHCEQNIVQVTGWAEAALAKN